MRLILRLLFFATITIFFVAFSHANKVIVSVNLFPFSYSADMPLAFLVIASIFVGFIVGFIIFSFRNISIRNDLASYKKKVKALENYEKGRKIVAKIRNDFINLS